MASEKSAPTTLLEAVNYFEDKDLALEFVAAIRWPDGVICPDCGKKEATFLQTRRLWKCRACKRQFSVKVGSIFEDSPIGLDKWLPAMWLAVNCKNGISSYELSRDLKVTQKTAWFMLHRLRLAMQAKSFEKMTGEVEVDETYIGAKARNMHKDRRERTKTGRWHGKVAVLGLLERHGDGKSRVRTQVVEGTKRAHLVGAMKENIELGSHVFSDALPTYSSMGHLFEHQFIDHAEAYAKGNVHTNGLENYWSLLKRSIKGTYVSVEPYHMFRYLDEQAFRFNERKATDGQRFVFALASVFGRRLTYAALTGADDAKRH